MLSSVYLIFNFVWWSETLRVTNLEQQIGNQEGGKHYFTQLYMCMCIYMCMYMYMYMSMYVCMCMYMCMYMCLCVYVYVHVCETLTPPLVLLGSGQTPVWGSDTTWRTAKSSCPDQQRSSQSDTLHHSLCSCESTDMFMFVSLWPQTSTVTWLITNVLSLVMS